MSEAPPHTEMDENISDSKQPEASDIPGDAAKAITYDVDRVPPCEEDEANVSPQQQQHPEDAGSPEDDSVLEGSRPQEGSLPDINQSSPAPQAADTHSDSHCVRDEPGSEPVEDFTELTTAPETTGSSFVADRPDDHSCQRKDELNTESPEKREPETIGSPTQSHSAADGADGRKAREESPAAEGGGARETGRLVDRVPEGSKEDSSPDINQSSPAPQAADTHSDSHRERDKPGSEPVEDFTELTTEPETIGSSFVADSAADDGPRAREESPAAEGGNVQFPVPTFVVVAVVMAAVAALLMIPRSPAPLPQMNPVEVLLRQVDELKTSFAHQRAELWARSMIHLKRHLQTSRPAAPVNLILTAGVRAERTLHCLARGLAAAFSHAVNASVLHIDGADAAHRDSDQVKLDIDSKLQGAFEGGQPVAVIHRFEELPPGSTLIFYRYCDHENAAYKETVLIFTVLLDVDEIPGKIHLNSVEEMVDDHLKKKFLSHGQPVSFDRMDLDKYGGLWSRISHLILPVAAEERVEYHGC